MEIGDTTGTTIIENGAVGNTREGTEADRAVGADLGPGPGRGPGQDPIPGHEQDLVQRQGPDRGQSRGQYLKVGRGR